MRNVKVSVHLVRYLVVVSKSSFCSDDSGKIRARDKRLKGLFKEGVRMGKWQEKYWKDEARWVEVRHNSEEEEEECRSVCILVEAVQTSCAPSQSFLC